MPVVLKAKDNGQLYEIPDNEREEALSTGKFTEHYRMKAKDDGKEYLIPAEEIGDALKTNKFELSEVYDQRKNIEANPTQSNRSPMNKLQSLIHGAGATMSMGFDDEIIGGIEGGIRTLKDGGNFSDNYESSRDAIRAKKDEAYDTNPWSYRAGSILGGIATPGLAGSATKSAMGAVKTATAVGAAQGAVQGAGDNTNPDRIGKDMIQGAVIGGGIGAVGGVVGKLASQRGRSQISSELKSFKEGYKEANPDLIPGINQLLKGWNGYKEASKTAGIEDEMFNFLQKSKKDLVSRMVEKDSIPKSQEKAMMNMLDKLSDEEYILRQIQDGDEEVIDWIAKQSGGNVADKQKFLKMSPEERQALRTLDTRQDAKGLVDITKKAQDDLWSDTKGKIAEHTKTARESFASDMQGHQQAYKEAIEDLSGMQELVGSSPLKHVKLSGKMIESGEGGRVGWDLDNGTNWGDATPEIQFNRLQKAREVVDSGIEWDKIKNGVRKPTQGELILMDYRKSLDDILKSTPGKVEADEANKIATELDNMLFGKTEFKGGVDPHKLRSLLNDSDTAHRFRDGLDKLREWSKSAYPEAQATAKEFLEKFETLLGKKQSSDALKNLSREGGPSALQIQRLDRSMKGDTNITKHAVKQTADFLLDNESTNAFLQESIGKPFKSMSAEEKTAFIKVYLQYKNAGGIGSPDVIRNNFNHELSKIK